MIFNMVSANVGGGGWIDVTDDLEWEQGQDYSGQIDYSLKIAVTDGASVMIWAEFTTDGASLLASSILPPYADLQTGTPMLVEYDSDGSVMAANTYEQIGSGEYGWKIDSYASAFSLRYIVSNN